MQGSTDVLGARILIVDDQESNLRLLGHTLRREGYREVSSTTNPVEVCPLHLEHPFALILLDLQMPRMNGFEVLDALAQSGGDPVAVLVLSADPSQLIASLEAGASDFLSKPLVLSEVLCRVRQLLDRFLAEEAVAEDSSLPPDSAQARATG